MSFNSQSRKLSVIIIVGMVVAVVMASPASATPPELLLSMTDTTAAAGDTNAWISVYLANYQETLSGFTIKIVMDHPDYVEFKTDVSDTIFDTTTQYCAGWENEACTLWVDTLIIDTVLSSAAVDTVGSMISGWEYVTARSFTSNQTDIKVTALADQLGPPYTPGLPPRTSPGLLFRLKLRVANEVTDSSDNIVNVKIARPIGETSFSDPYGDLIGVITEYNCCDSTYIYCDGIWDGFTCDGQWRDTTQGDEDSIVVDTFFQYWFCEEWDIGNPDSCVSWLYTFNDDSASLADSISIDERPWSALDTTTMFYVDGVFTVDFSDCKCGDVNGDDLINVGDAVALVNYIFKQGAPPANEACADVNHNDGLINVGDVVYLINFIFKQGASPDCGL